MKLYMFIEAWWFCHTHGILEWRNRGTPKRKNYIWSFCSSQPIIPVFHPSNIPIGAKPLSSIVHYSCRRQTTCVLHSVSRPLQNAPFCPISVSDSNFNPQNTQCIPPVIIFVFLEREQNWTFFKGLNLRQFKSREIMFDFLLLKNYMSFSGRRF